MKDVYQVPVSASLDILDGIHQRLVAILCNMTPKHWQIKVNHPEVGEMLLEDYIKAVTDHGKNHLAAVWELFETLQIKQ